jgi:hypothetical protein
VYGKQLFKQNEYLSLLSNQQTAEVFNKTCEIGPKRQDHYGELQVSLIIFLIIEGLV